MLREGHTTVTVLPLTGPFGSSWPVVFIICCWQITPEVRAFTQEHLLFLTASVHQEFGGHWLGSAGPRSCQGLHHLKV